jgi:gas vesicle protein GvpO
VADEPRKQRPARQPSQKRRPKSGELAAGAKRQLTEITGLEAGAVTALERSDDDGWTATVELVELSRVPKSADVVGVYQTQLDASGTLLEYRRVRRYVRGDAGGVVNG